MFLIHTDCGHGSALLLGKVEYGEGDPDVYVLPGSVATGEAAEQVKDKLSDVSVAQLHAARWQPRRPLQRHFRSGFLAGSSSAILRSRRFRGRTGELVGSHTRAFREAWGEPSRTGPCRFKAEQSNTSIVLETGSYCKIYRRD